MATKSEKFTTVGTTRFSIPRGVTWVTVVGCGGGGGGAGGHGAFPDQISAGGGGGTGAAVIATTIAVKPEDTIEVVIGNGGAGGTGGTAGERGRPPIPSDGDPGDPPIPPGQGQPGLDGQNSRFATLLFPGGRGAVSRSGGSGSTEGAGIPAVAGGDGAPLNDKGRKGDRSPYAAGGAAGGLDGTAIGGGGGGGGSLGEGGIGNPTPGEAQFHSGGRGAGGGGGAGGNGGTGTNGGRGGAGEINVYWVE